MRLSLWKVIHYTYIAVNTKRGKMCLNSYNIYVYRVQKSEKYMIYFNNLYVFDHQFTVGKINNIFNIFSGRSKG